MAIGTLTAMEKNVLWYRTWVGLLDVMGFSAQLSDERKRDHLALAYAKALKRVDLYRQSRFYSVQEHQSGNLENPIVVDIRIFSDSIFVVARRLTIDPVFKLSNDYSGLLQMTQVTVQLLMNDLLSEGLAVRGAIAFGEMADYGPESNIVMGKAILDANAWEKEQEWAWVSVAPASLPMYEKHHPTLGRHPDPSEVITYVQTKSGNPRRTIALKPFGANEEFNAKIVDMISKNLQETHVLAIKDDASNEAIRNFRKWQNTAAFIGAFKTIEPQDLYQQLTWQNAHEIA